MAPKALIPVLVTLMLLTGVCNTLLTKYQVRLAVDLFMTSLIDYLGSTMRPKLRYQETSSFRATRPPNVRVLSVAR